MEITTSLSKRSKWEVNQKENIWKHFPNFQGHLSIFQGFQQKNRHFQGFQGRTFIFKAFQGFLRIQGPLATLNTKYELFLIRHDPSFFYRFIGPVIPSLSLL